MTSSLSSPHVLTRRKLFNLRQFYIARLLEHPIFKLFTGNIQQSHKTIYNNNISYIISLSHIRDLLK